MSPIAKVERHDLPRLIGDRDPGGAAVLNVNGARVKLHGSLSHIEAPVTSSEVIFHSSSAKEAPHSAPLPTGAIVAMPPGATIRPIGCVGEAKVAP
jgi:hypothetical protein